MEPELTDFTTSWLGSVNDRMIEGDFLASCLNNLMDRVPLLRWRQMCEQGPLEEKKQPCEYTIISKNNILLFFYIMDEKLES